MLAADLDLVHIAVGDIFRWNVQHHTKLGAQVRRTMAAGLLVSDDLVEGVVRDRLTQHDWNYGFIVDGFPRNERQAEFFLESYDIDGVIHLDLPDTRGAQAGARQAAVLGLRHGLQPASPAARTEAGQCDVCGSALVTREDDTEEALAVRLREYHEKTNPVLAIFGARSTWSPSTPRPSPEQVQQEIRAKLSLPPYHPARSASPAEAAAASCRTAGPGAVSAAARAAVGARLRARSADRHAAPAAAPRRRAVVERPAAVVGAADLEPGPGASGRRLGGDQQQRGEPGAPARAPARDRPRHAVVADLQPGGRPAATDRRSRSGPAGGRSRARGPGARRGAPRAARPPAHIVVGRSQTATACGRHAPRTRRRAAAQPARAAGAGQVTSASQLEQGRG